MWRFETPSGVEYVTSNGEIVADPEFQAPVR
jgi:hypothetical protein